MLDFLPGERLKFITITVIDNPVPELAKIFRVELYNADGGGEKMEPKIIILLCFVVLIRSLLLATKLNLLHCSVFCVLCCCVLPTYLPTNRPSYLPFDIYSPGVSPV